MHKYNILVHREIVYLDVFQIKLHKEEIKYPQKTTGYLASLPPRPQSGKEIPVKYSITQLPCAHKL